MNGEAIQKIKEREAFARDFLKKSADFNRDRIEKAKADAEKRYRDAEAVCLSRLKAATDEEEKKAKLLSDKKMLEAEKEAEELTLSAAAKEPEAIKLIIREIIEKWQ